MNILGHTWGRCYEHNFVRFFANFLRKKWRFFLKTNVMMQILKTLAVV
jgi:hypothetical protein